MCAVRSFTNQVLLKMPLAVMIYGTLSIVIWQNEDSCFVMRTPLPLIGTHSLPGAVPSTW